jgi:hypothetical protein
MELDIDPSLVRRLERRADERGFESAEAYAAVVLETVLAELEAADDDRKSPAGQDDREDDLEERLGDLGYLG